MIEFRHESKGLLKLWKMPEHGRRYIISADVSEGLDGGNYSAAHVLEIESFEQVAVWHGMEEPYQFGKILFNLGEYYNGALVAPEKNNNGISTIDYLRANDYPSIYQMLKLDGQSIEDSSRLGWITNMHTRALMIDSLKEAIRSNAIILNDPETLAELRTFVRNPRTGKVEAAPGSQDDLVISLAIGCYIISTLPREANRELPTGSYMDRTKSRWGGSFNNTIGRGGY